MTAFQKFKIKTKSLRVEFGRFWHDVLRDTNSAKYSMTKFAALLGLILLIIVVCYSMKIMIAKNEIDHVLIVELIGLVLTLLGFKNNFGYTKNGNNQHFTMDSMPKDDSYGGHYGSYGGYNNGNDGGYHGEQNEGFPNQNNNSDQQVPLDERG